MGCRGSRAYEDPYNGYEDNDHSYDVLGETDCKIVLLLEPVFYELAVDKKDYRGSNCRNDGIYYELNDLAERSRCIEKRFNIEIIKKVSKHFSILFLFIWVNNTSEMPIIE